MRVYLASPNSQIQAQACVGFPVLLSYAICAPWLVHGYAHAYPHLLIDSGAYSVYSSGRRLDVQEYADWAAQWDGIADAVAGLDDIAGDWRTSLRNYAAQPVAFPTFHSTDPEDLLPELVAMATERGGWLGIGIAPPREPHGAWLRRTLKRIPPSLHVHGWALRRWAHCGRLDSVDSTSWWRKAMALRTLPELRHLTLGECLEIITKRYARWERKIAADDGQLHLLREG